MRKLILPLLLLLMTFSLTGQESSSTNCAFAQAVEVIHGNQIRTQIYPQGYFFAPTRVDESFQVPYSGPKTPNTFYASALWIGAKDTAGNLKIAANTYAHRNAHDFWPGPVSDDGTIDSTACVEWDTLWSVQQYEIVRHLRDYTEDDVVDNQLPSIFGWPGKGNPYFEEINGFVLPDQSGLSAPFYDKNSNGVYEPQLGEYPHPDHMHEEIIPSQIMWCIYNDAGGIHTNSLGDALGIDVQQTTYALQCGGNSFLDYALFSSFRIRNRSSSGLRDVIFGHWSDYDLGCWGDDFLGSYPEGNSGFVYNEDNIDGIYNVYCGFLRTDTYGRNPPVQSCTFLNQEMTGSTLYVNGGIGNWPEGTYDPDQPEEFYNMLNGFWPDGSPLYTDSIGYMSDTTGTSKYIFDGDPRDSNSWSEINLHPFPFADQRMVISSELGSLEVGQYVDVDLAYSFHRDTSLDHLENVGLMYEQVDELHQLYDSQFAGMCDVAFVECDDDCVYPGDANHDGIVNNCDYLELVAAFGSTGTKRNAPLSWTPQYSSDWDASSPEGYNLKHTDCNASGITDSFDLDFVDFHYGFINEYFNSSEHHEFGDDIRLILRDTVKDYYSSSFFPLKVIFDNVNHDSLMGITFAVEFDPHYFRYYQWEPTPLFLGGALISRESEIEGSSSFTWVRADGKNEHVDSVLILKPLFIITRWDLIASDMPDTTSIKITHAKGILASGELIDLRGDSLDIIFRPVSVSAKDVYSSRIKVFPNPSDGTIHIQGDHILPDSEYTLFDINGRLVASGKLDGLKIDVEAPSGMYVLALNGEFRARALVIIQE